MHKDERAKTFMSRCKSTRNNAGSLSLIRNTRVKRDFDQFSANWSRDISKAKLINIID